MPAPPFTPTPATRPVPPLEGFQDQIQALRECGRDFHRRGWSLGTSSNYSVVVHEDPVAILMTGSGFDKGNLLPDHFLLVDAESRPLHATQLKPSAEALLHSTLVQGAGARAVLHTHSPWATVLSEHFASRGSIPLRGYEMLKGLAGITTHDIEIHLPILPNTQDIPTLANDLRSRLAPPATHFQHGFLISGHGLYAWGTDLPSARRHIEVLEFLFEVLARKQLLFGHL